MRVLQDDQGATTAEYGLLLVGIALTAMFAVGPFGARVAAIFGPVQAFFP
jgi:Flp pilus assembly pilin Flp